METTTPNFQYNDDEAAKRTNNMFMMAPVGPPGIGPPLPPHQQYPNPAFNQFPPPTPPLPPPQQFQQPPPGPPPFISIQPNMLNQLHHQQFNPHPQRTFTPAGMGIQPLTTFAHHQQQQPQQFQPPNSQSTFPQPPFRPIHMMGGALTLPTTMTAVATHQSNNNDYQADLNVNMLRKEFNDALAKKDAIIAQLREDKSILHVEISDNKAKLKKANQDLETARARIAELQKKLQEFEAGQQDVKDSAGTEKSIEQQNTEGEGDQKPAAQTDAPKQELTTMDSTTLLQDLLRDHREIGNWADMVGSMPQDDPSATSESFKSKRAQYDIPHQGPFKLFVTNLNLPPNVRKANPHHKPYGNRNDFDRMHNDVFQHFGGQQNLASVFFHFPTSQGICMLEARDFESCIRVLRKNGQYYKGKPAKVEYVVPNMESTKHAKFTPVQLDAQLEAYKEARSRPPIQAAEEKSAVKFNPFGEAKPINMASKYDEMQAKLDKERAEGKSRESIVSNKSGAPRQQMPSLSEDAADQTTGSSNSKATTPGPQPLVFQQHNQNQQIPKLMRQQSQDSGGRSSARPPSGPPQFHQQPYGGGGVFQQSYAPNMQHHGRVILPTSYQQQRPPQQQFDGGQREQQHHHHRHPQPDRRQSQPYNQHNQPRPPRYNQGGPGAGGPPRDEAAAGATAPKPRDQKPPNLMEEFDSQPKGGQPMRTGGGPRPRGDNRQPGQHYKKQYRRDQQNQQDQQSRAATGGGGMVQQFPEHGGRNNNYRPAGRPQKSRSEGQTSPPPPSVQSGNPPQQQQQSDDNITSASADQQQRNNNHNNNHKDRPYPSRRQQGERVFTRRGGKGSSSFKPDNANRQDGSAAGGDGDRYKRRSQQPGGGAQPPQQEVQQKDSTASEKSVSIEQQQPVIPVQQQSEHEQHGGNHRDSGAREPEHQDAGGAEAAEEAKVVDPTGGGGGDEQSKKKGKNKKTKKNNKGEAGQAVKNNKFFPLNEVTDQDQ